MKNQLKYIKVALIISIFTSINFNAKAQLIDKIVAQVGDEIVMLSDIQQQKLQMIQEGMNVSSSTDCEILEEVLYQKLLINQAQLDSLIVSDDQVNGEMEQRLRYFEEQIGGREELEEFYGKSVAQIKAEFFTIIKKRILSEMMEDKITENMVITPKDVKNFYNKLPKDSIPYINSKISIAQIVIYPEVTDTDKTMAKDKLESYRAQIIGKKKRFQTIATLYSDDPGSKYKDGDLGWQRRGTMVPEFEAALFNLEKNEISPVFETQYGYHIIQMLDRKGDNYHVRHILISAKSNNNAFDRAAEKLDQIYKDINANVITFVKAVELYSNDDKSNNNGGKIVNPYSNDYYWDIQNINNIDPQMYRIIDKMKVGGISVPSLYDNLFEQKNGVRIVQLLAKTKPHLANLKDDYQLIQNACAETKKKEIINEWIQSKITGAYIRIDKDYYNCDFMYNWIK
jgi:peptidyl-prolyl cis-trans isomerase SurA